MSIDCDIIFYANVLGLESINCDRLHKQYSTFPSSEYDPTCQRLAAIIECLEIKKKALKFGWNEVAYALEKCRDELLDSEDVILAINRYYHKD